MEVRFPYLCCVVLFQTVQTVHVRMAVLAMKIKLISMQYVSALGDILAGKLYPKRYPVRRIS